MQDWKQQKRSGYGGKASVLAAIAIVFLAGCDRLAASGTTATSRGLQPCATVATALTHHVAGGATAIVAAARSQIGRTTIYDPVYVRLTYPGGDIPIERGVCADVVVRALRTAYAMDLQKLVHDDMAVAFAQYPAIWGLKRPDTNIDHRRVPNLRKYFERKGYALAVTTNRIDYAPGDIVACMLPRNLPHIMVVSDKVTDNGTPLVIHNIGGGAQEEDRLFAFTITGHYRIRQKPR